MAVLESLELPASAQSITAAIDAARGLTDEPDSAGTSVRLVRKVLRQLFHEEWAMRLTANRWYGCGVYVRADPDGAKLWWPAHKWRRVRDDRLDQRAKRGPTDMEIPVGEARSELAKAVDFSIEADRAYYKARRRYFGPNG
ncbi:hypothetical protein [Amycolatopsis sp. PS_44_ISF1]|uniref:hypothetical protein n=1 Tax=Amycolatopsis sp. PS_44_ISF1 TaxID=2974917 RepID=UPI0028DE3469|nr:hypothetical protein [Amycolatopsis sp. PS_44_ISF1]MDT8913672.1 hypothetical protein [Amycolatopsis sp. PS_44_ISF1]